MTELEEEREEYIIYLGQSQGKQYIDNKQQVLLVDIEQFHVDTGVQQREVYQFNGPIGRSLGQFATKVEV